MSSLKPNGLSWVTPHLIVTDVLKSIDFYQSAFGFEMMYMASEDENGNSQIYIMDGDGSNVIQLTDEGENYNPEFAPKYRNSITIGPAVQVGGGIGGIQPIDP